MNEINCMISLDHADFYVEHYMFDGFCKEEILHMVGESQFTISL